MNDERTSNKRPLLCLVNVKQDTFHEDSLTPFDWNIADVSCTRLPELLGQLDRMNPDCTVLHIDSIQAEPRDWLELSHYCEMRHIPIVLTGAEAETLQGTVMADGYYLQDPAPAGLTPRVRFLIKRRQRILDQILIDPLTGAYNYRYLQREVEKQLNDMKRSHDTFSMVYMELDALERADLPARRFRQKALADFIQKSIRPTDCLAHHVTEGFILVLPKTVKEDALKLMNRLSDRFSTETAGAAGDSLPLTFSSKVLEFVDASRTADDCLSLMAFGGRDPAERSGLVLDGALQGPESSIRKLKLAIIDDDRLIREMLKHQLSDIGGDQYDVEIRAFADGEDFFEDPWHKQNERFLLLIDRIMPKMDGLEVLRRIRSGYDRRRYLVLMISSRKAEADISLAIQRGANDYMVKPFSLKELRARILRLVGGLR